MSGMTYIIIGVLIAILGSLGFAGLQIYIMKKKKQMKEQYHIYQ